MKGLILALLAGYLPMYAPYLLDDPSEVGTNEGTEQGQSVHIREEMAIDRSHLCEELGGQAHASIWEQ